MIYLILFWEFAKVGIFCVGGGYASMPLIQAAVVDTYHWMSLGEFVDIFTISQMTPGPIGINAATFAGMKIAGIPGAVCATVGFCTPSLLLGIILANLFFRYGNIGPIRRHAALLFGGKAAACCGGPHRCRRHQLRGPRALEYGDAA